MRRALSLVRNAARRGSHLLEITQHCQTFSSTRIIPALASTEQHLINSIVAHQRTRFSSSAPPVPPPPSPSPPLPTGILEITDAQSFNAAVALSNTVPVVLDAYAMWCGPCKQLDPVLKQQVAAAGGKIALAKMDIDTPALKPLVEQLKITSVPTLIMLYGGRAVDIKQGAPPPAELAKWIAKAIELADAVSSAAGAKPAPETESIDPKSTLEEAFAAARAPGAAVEQLAPCFASVMNSQSADAAMKAEATAGLALCALLDGDLQTAKELISNAKSAAEQAQQAVPGAAVEEVAAVEATLSLAEEISAVEESEKRTIEELEAAVEKDKKDLPAVHALALKWFKAGRAEDAVDAALMLVKRDREWKEQAGKQLTLKIADALGPKSEVGKTARRRLSNIWFI